MNFVRGKPGSSNDRGPPGLDQAWRALGSVRRSSVGAEAVLAWLYLVVERCGGVAPRRLEVRPMEVADWVGKDAASGRRALEALDRAGLIAVVDRPRNGDLGRLRGRPWLIEVLGFTDSPGEPVARLAAQGTSQREFELAGPGEGGAENRERGGDRPTGGHDAALPLRLMDPAAARPVDARSRPSEAVVKPQPPLVGRRSKDSRTGFIQDSTDSKIQSMNLGSPVDQGGGGCEATTASATNCGANDVENVLTASAARYRAARGAVVSLLAARSPDQQAAVVDRWAEAVALGEIKSRELERILARVELYRRRGTLAGSFAEVFGALSRSRFLELRLAWIDKRPNENSPTEKGTVRHVQR